MRPSLKLVCKLGGQGGGGVTMESDLPSARQPTRNRVESSTFVEKSASFCEIVIQQGIECWKNITIPLMSTDFGGSYAATLLRAQTLF